MGYAAGMSESNDFRDDERPTSKLSLVLLAVPVLALIFPAVYNRETPTLLGFPFFYWYQLAWVVLATVILGVVYMLRKDSSRD